jgi:hypothetical protein
MRITKGGRDIASQLLGFLGGRLKLPGMLAQAILRGDSILQCYERRLEMQVLSSQARKHEPVFLIGAPRSGSTLLYKTFVDRYRVTYINNLASFFFRTICLGTKIAKRFGVGVPPQGYNFEYGAIDGWGAPNECGAFWYRWFPEGINVYVGSGALSEETQNEIRRQVYAASAIMDSPMVFKNLYNSMRIAPLIECFPKASFIVCLRDPAQNALSLLRGRINQQNDKHNWWSLPPREGDKLLGSHYSRQVAGQVYYINRQVREDMQQFGTDRFVVVPYEEFCGDVHGVLDRVRSFLCARGHIINPRDDEVPSQFEVRHVEGLDILDKAAVERAVQMFLEGDG